MDYINADEIKKNLKCSDIKAAQIAEHQREECLSKLRDFCFETVLSTSRNLYLLERARDAGYFIRCYYVLTADPRINVYRVKMRVASGGHDVPEEKIYTRYDRAMALVPAVVAVSDICHIYDNSEAQAFRIFKKRKDVCFFDECDDFLECINPSVILLLNDFGKYFISRKRFVKHMRVHLRCSKFLYASAQCVHELVERPFTCESAMFYFIGKPTRAAEALT